MLTLPPRRRLATRRGLILPMGYDAQGRRNMLMVNHLIGFGAGGGSLPAAEFGSSDISAANLTEYTFSAMTFNAAAGDRHIVAAVALVGGTVTAIDSVTIGGISATIAVQRKNTGSPVVGGLAIAAVPTGTTGDVVTTGDAAAARAGAAVWSVTGLDSATATDTASNDVESANPIDLTIDVVANGLVFAAGCDNSTSAKTSTWSGVNESYDDGPLGDGAGNHSGGFQSYAAAQTGLTVEQTYSSAPNDAVLVAAAFR